MTENRKEKRTLPTNEIPEWIIRDIDQARFIMGLMGPEWNVYLQMNPNLDVRGSCQVQPFNGNVTMKFSNTSDDGVEDNLEGTKTVFHEVTHWSMAALTVFVEELIDRIGDKDLKEFYEQQWEHIIEAYVTRTSRCLVEALNQYGVTRAADSPSQSK